MSVEKAWISTPLTVCTGGAESRWRLCTSLVLIISELMGMYSLVVLVQGTPVVWISWKGVSIEHGSHVYIDLL